MLKIGVSEDYTVCKGLASSSGMGNDYCRYFLNKSIEKLCDRHKMEYKQVTMKQIRSSRPTLAHSTNINAFALRKKFEQDHIDKQIFGKKRAPPQKLSAEQKVIIAAKVKEDTDLLNALLLKRGDRARRLDNPLRAA